MWFMEGVFRGVMLYLSRPDIFKFQLHTKIIKTLWILVLGKSSNKNKGCLFKSSNYDIITLQSRNETRSSIGTIIHSYIWTKHFASVKPVTAQMQIAEWYNIPQLQVSTYLKSACCSGVWDVDDASIVEIARSIESRTTSGELSCTKHNVVTK